MPRKKDKKNEKIDESWLLPYSDMLTLLLALFIVMFAMSEVDVKKFEKLAYIFESEFANGGGIVDQSNSIISNDIPLEVDQYKEPPKKEEEPPDKGDILAAKEYQELKAIQKEIEQFAKENNLTSEIGTKLTAAGLLISVKTDVTFDSGSARVREHGRKVAKEIASFLHTNPPHEVVVNGHADDRPIHNSDFGSNWELSAMRAIQFMYILIDSSELDPKWFSARGYGEYQPTEPNTNAKNRAMNRRVEVLIRPNHDIEDEVEAD